MTRRGWLAVGLAVAAVAAAGGAVSSQNDPTRDGLASRIVFDLPPDFAPLPRLSGDAHEGARWPVVRRAWGDSAAGCVLLVHELEAGKASATGIAEGLQMGLRAAELQLEADLQPNDDQTVWSGRLRDPVIGDVRLLIEQDGSAAHASAVTCFWGERDPERCASSCEAAISSLELAP